MPITFIKGFPIPNVAEIPSEASDLKDMLTDVFPNMLSFYALQANTYKNVGLNACSDVF
jgi:hypothetical protein